MQKQPFGSTRDGRNVDMLTLRRGAMEAEIITYGAALRALRVPDKSGNSVDVALGYDDVRGYEDNGGYLGAVVGRYANRIAGASCLIDGERVPLVANEGAKQLHGGPEGFSTQVFSLEEAGEDFAVLTYVSPDGQGGFPGTLTLRVTYALTGQGLSIRYEAAGDKATHCNITNHAYFNLNGSGDILGHRLWLAAGRFTPVDGDSIPVDMARSVEGTPFDFTAEKPVGRDIGQGDEQLHNVGGYDHNYVLDPGQGLRLAARLTGEASGIVMETWTEKPGIQFYSGNFLKTNAAKGGGVYVPRQGLCLETQFFPDSPNHPEWGDILLRPGRRYDFTTEYRFGTV
ncbi:MAG: galactose mutarotase [Oscillospiraceae bacterium]|nr:galactose mutarotase [Oscillospiraceae bacterium]